MKLNTIARTLVAVILSLGAATMTGGIAAADDPNCCSRPYIPPFFAES